MSISDEHHEADPAGGLLAGAVVDPARPAAEGGARARQRAVAVAVALAVFALVAALVASVSSGGSSPAGGAAARATVAAEAAGVLLLRPGHDPVRVAHAKPVVGVAAQAQGAEATYALDQVANVSGITTSARVAVARRSAAASSAIDRIELLDGRVVLTGAKLAAVAQSEGGLASGGLELGEGAVLEVDGQRRTIGVNERIAIEGVGTVIVNEQAVVANAPRGDAQTGPRYRTVGALVHVRISQDALGLPAGSQLVIGRVDAGVREGKVKRVAHPGGGGATETVPVPPAAVVSARPAGLQPGAPRPGEGALPRRPVDVRGSNGGVATASLNGYLFPVLGKSSYSNDWGAPRASTGVPHQGTDVFAAEGTPIVAVADGVLDRVGWNPIGGYRFWLFDQYGNSFYHAHLSAYSPLAQDGARVKRGDVIGFVGHTGDAQYTPPHLHFEIHPGNGAATNPFPFLNAWKQGTAVAIGLITAGGADRVAPLALLGFSDISSSSGLGSSVLSRVPDTRARSIEQETEPRPTDESLKGAIDGAATTG